MLFKSNKIKDDEETVAEKLCAAREEKNITLAAAAKSLAINPEYLAALENGDYAALPSGIYAKTFLRQYSSFLGLNPDKIINKYKKEGGKIADEKKRCFFQKKNKQIGTGHLAPNFKEYFINHHRDCFFLLPWLLFAKNVFFARNRNLPAGR
jgi:transcriptional regulator with XRE-family HTH domain